MRPGAWQAGWGKSPTWVLASHYAGVKDVTPRYTNDLPAVHQRRPAGVSATGLGLLDEPFVSKAQRQLVGLGA